MGRLQEERYVKGGKSVIQSVYFAIAWRQPNGHIVRFVIPIYFLRTSPQQRSDIPSDIIPYA